MTPGITSVTIGGSTSGAMGAGGNMGFATSGDTTGDVVTYEVGVPSNCVGIVIGAIRTTDAGTGTCCNAGNPCFMLSRWAVLGDRKRLCRRGDDRYPYLGR